MRVSSGGGLSADGSGRDDGAYRIYREYRGETPVLVKVPADPTDERSAAALRREHRVLLDLDVPGVIRPVALEERDGAPALVLEDLDDESLAQRLVRGPLTTEGFLAVAPQLARSLAAVHQRNIPRASCSPPAGMAPR
jgi:hypothetical protein